MVTDTLLRVVVAAALATVPAGSLRADIAPEIDPAQTSKDAWTVLQTHCFRCHGEGGASEGGFGDVPSHRLLLASEKVVPGNLEGSLLWERVTDDLAPMPPEQESQRPSAEELKALRAWILSGAPPFDEATAAPAHVTGEEVVQAIHADLAATPERDRTFRRYFTLTHLQNAGLSASELESYRHGLSKLVNSLSWRPQVAIPHTLKAKPTIIRIDLRDYAWKADDWDEAVFRVRNNRFVGSEEEAQVQRWTGAIVPHVFADAFVFEASQPPSTTSC